MPMLQRRSGWRIWSAFGLLFLIFITITYDHSKAWKNPNRGDQDLDLTLGLKIRNLEALSDGYHHPLLPALVSPFAEKTLAYFAKAKLVNVAIGAVTFWVIAYVGCRMVGPIPTFLALIAVAPGLSNKSAEFTAEPLLMLWVVLTFYWLVRGFQWQWYWALAGMAAGFAYLTKGSGLLLPLAYALAMLRLAPDNILVPRFFLFPTAYVLIASPLLIYNWEVYGSPFFNYNTAHVIWLDYTEEQMIMFDKGPPSMWSYLTTHSLQEILHRWLKGLVIVRGVEWVWPFLGVFLLAPKRWLAYFRESPEKGPMITVASTLVVTFYLPFAWSAVVQRGIRYLLPIFPIIFLLLADLVVFYGACLAQRLWAPAWRKRLADLGSAGALGILALVWMAQLAIRDFEAPLAIDFQDRATAEVFQLLDSPHFDGKKVLFGPSHELVGNWLFRYRVALPIIPPGVSSEGLLTWLADQQIDYILANREMITRRRHTVQDYLDYSEAAGVQVLKLEPTWEVVYQAPFPPAFILIRVR
jgi:hypothetical protein